MAGSSKGRTIGYWITTALLALGFAGGGLVDLFGTPEQTRQVTDLGIPAYLLPLLGTANLLAVFTILAPRLPRLKEWAYAGIVIDLVGATYSHIAHGDGPDKIVPPIVFLAIALASYFLRPEERRLPDPA